MTDLDKARAELEAVNAEYEPLADAFTAAVSGSDDTFDRDAAHAAIFGAGGQRRRDLRAKRERLRKRIAQLEAAEKAASAPDAG